MSINPRRNSVLDEIAAQSLPKSPAEKNNASSLPRAEVRRPDVEIGSVENIRRGRLGRESRYSVLQTGVEELLLEEEIESCATSLPSIDTKISRNRFSFSPRVSSSPISFPSLSEFGSIPAGQDRPTSPRTKSYTSSTGRRSRRNTARSGSSSWSPASAYLSQWSRGEVATANPLEEGQEIGDTTKYILGRQVGYGGFSVVKEVFTIEDGEKVRRAAKIVLKHIDGKTEQENDTLQHDFEHEASIWRYLKHPYILPLLEVYETSYATFCITQLNTGGTLHDLVRNIRKYNKATSSPITSPTLATTSPSSANPQRLPIHLQKRYLYQLANALRYLHQDLYIVHRDIKLENCLLNLSPKVHTSSSTTPSATTMTGNILLCDFGMADFISHDDRDPTARPSSSSSFAATTLVAGSLPYSSPEALASAVPLYQPAIDIWAFGVVCYALLTLKLPFDHEFAPKLIAMINDTEWDVDALREAVENSGTEDNDEDAQEVADQAVLLVKGCLEKDVEKRWEIGKVLGCAFFAGCADLYEVEPGV